MEAIQQSEASVVRDAESELLELEARLDRARVAGDVEVFESVLGEEFTTTSPAGGRSGKEEMLEDNRAGHLVVRSSKSTDITVQCHGSIAVVTGTASLVAKYRGHDISGRYSYTHVYRHRDGRWQVVAAHSSRQVPDWAYLIFSRLTGLFRLARR